METGSRKRSLVATGARPVRRVQRQALDHGRWALAPGACCSQRRVVFRRWRQLDTGNGCGPVAAAAVVLAVVYRDRIWALGGWSKENGNFGDVWFTKDGKNWTELKSNVKWTNRHEHSTMVFQDKIWVMGGYAAILNSEVWTLELPEGW